MPIAAAAAVVAALVGIVVLNSRASEPSIGPQHARWMDEVVVVGLSRLMPDDGDGERPPASRPRLWSLFGVVPSGPAAREGDDQSAGGSHAAPGNGSVRRIASKRSRARICVIGPGGLLVLFAVASIPAPARPRAGGANKMDEPVRCHWPTQLFRAPPEQVAADRWSCGQVNL